MKAARPVRAFSSLVLAEAHMVRTVLVAHGIEAFLKNEHLRGVIGLVAVADATVEVWVPGDDATKAHHILSEFARRDQSGRLSVTDPDTGEVVTVEASGERRPNEPSQCPECGEEWEPGFDICWSCEHELPTG